MFDISSMYKPAEIPETGESFGTGWLPPMADTRDYTVENPKITEIIEKIPGFEISSQRSPETLSIPTTVDLRKWCSPIENQGSLGSCTAHAGIGVVEYFQKRAFGKHIEGSRLFVYKTTRNMMGVVGDTGAWLRNTMAALAYCGVAPEMYWPYTTKKQPDSAGERTFDDEPPAFVYSVADNFEALHYFCHDPLGKSVNTKELLANLKLFLASGIPSMFGFYGFPSFSYSNVKGGIPYPGPRERAIWGHAVVAVGYDDYKKIKNTKYNKETTGALLIRNSWGTGWGDGGYGWLPYEYVLDRFALDFWSLLSMGWVESGNFGLDL